MTLYRDSEQLYSSTQALFRLIEEQDPGAADAVLATHLVIRLHTSEPEIEFTINGRRGAHGRRGVRVPRVDARICFV